MKNKIFRILALVLTIVMVLPLGISNVFAEEEIEGINIYYDHSITNTCTLCKLQNPFYSCKFC